MLTVVVLALCWLGFANAEIPQDGKFLYVDLEVGQRGQQTLLSEFSSGNKQKLNLFVTTMTPMMVLVDKNCTKCNVQTHYDSKFSTTQEVLGYGLSKTFSKLSRGP